MCVSGVGSLLVECTSLIYMVVSEGHAGSNDFDTISELLIKHWVHMYGFPPFN